MVGNPSSDQLGAIRKRTVAQQSRYGARWNQILKDRAWLLAEVDRLREKRGACKCLRCGAGSEWLE